MPEQTFRPQRREEASSSVAKVQDLEAHPPAFHSRLQEASDFTTPGHILADLAQDPDMQIRQAVVSNPNTPWPILELLAGEFPREFFANPLGPLQLIAHPELVSVEPAFWEALLRVAPVPEQWWRWLQSHPSLGTYPAVRLHVQYAGEAAHHPHGIPRGDEEDFLFALLKPLTPLPSWKAASGSRKKMTAAWITEKHLRWLAHRSRSKVREAVASHPHAPAEVLSVLAHDRVARVCKAVATHPGTPTAALQILAQHRNKGVREAVASNTHTPAKLLRTLARDSSWSVRSHVASHPRTPAHVLRTLARDQELKGGKTTGAQVRQAVAGNPRTPPDVLQALARDSWWSVLHGVAGNAQAPAQALRVLSQFQDRTIREKVAENPQAPPDVLRELAQDSAWTVRLRVAHNAQVTRDILCLLSQDPVWSVRSNVASHPQTPGEVLRELARDTDENASQRAEVRSATARNPQTPADALYALMLDTWKKAEHGAWIRKMLARNPQTPPDMLQALAADTNPQVRITVVGNVQTPPEVLRVLAHDQEWSIRFLADLVLNSSGTLEDTPDKQAWKNELGEFLLEIARGKQGSSGVALKRQLRFLAELNAPDTIRQAVFTTLAAAWDASLIGSAFAEGGERESYRYLTSADIPPTALQKLAISPCWEVRYLVALHHRTPRETRQLLSQDGNRYVRAIARARQAEMT